MNDKTLLHILNHDPQRGMTLLVEQYTGLVWKVISLHLRNPENIKECTNDTFAEFYFHRDRFDPERSSLAVWLTAIARNLAISRFRKERKHLEEPLPSVLPAALLADQTDEIALAEIQADLERAMDALRPDELQIIRMRYYDGMTVREIADSLELPYETVKKRHQRGIAKLRRTLFLTILILLALLTTACSTYVVLRHFDIIPPIFSWEKQEPEEEPESELPEGNTDDNNDNSTSHFPEQRREDPLTENEEEHITASTATETGSTSHAEESSGLDISSYTLTRYGINETAAAAVYGLEAPVTAENDQLFISLDQASYLNERLVLIFSYVKKEPDIAFSVKLLCNGQQIDHSLETSYTENFTEKRQITFSDFEFPIQDTEQDEVNLTAIIQVDRAFESLPDLILNFTLCSAPQEPLDSYAMQTYEAGGLLAIPRLEDGSLIVAIYPLNGGAYTIQPSLIRGVRGETEGGSITVTNSDGTEMTGSCMRYFPSNTSTYFEWNFGPASPGEYTLHVPYLYVTAPFPEDIHLSVDLTGLTWDDTIQPIPGGSFWIEEVRPMDLYSEKALKWFPDTASNYPYYSLWELYLGYQSENDTFTIIKPCIGFHCEVILAKTLPGNADTSGTRFSFSVGCFEDILGTGIQELYIKNINENFHDYSSVTVSLTPITVEEPSVLLRWNQNFDLTFTVDEEINTDSGE